jgi:hypothetical protein
MMLRAYARVAALSWIATLGLALPVWAAAVPITYCGQIVRGRGYLTGNLDCSGFVGHAVILERGKLDLKGFTMRGAAFYGVHCQSSCQINGPGTIAENGLDGVHAENWAIVRDAVITRNGLSGVSAHNINGGTRLVIRNATITENGLNGIEADNLAVLRDSNISNNGQSGINVGVQFCDTGGRVILVRTTATGNGGSCDGSSVCADLDTCGRNNSEPRLRNESQCNTSHVRGSGIPGTTWGICSLD